MPRYRLLVAYDGRSFAGWQSQPSGNTVQDVLERALARITKTQGSRVSASGRTDAGVHAHGQVVHFDSPAGLLLPEAAWVRALNVNLPPAVRILECAAVAADFHARFDAVGKTYHYRLWTGLILPPLEAGLAWHFPRPFDRHLLAEACQMLEGTHDFSAFAAFRGNETGNEDNRRTLWKVQPVYDPESVCLQFHGSGFLYKMVRLLTGALLRVASGKAPMAWMTDLLEGRGRGKCAFVAPADGLYLVEVHYRPPA